MCWNSQVYLFPFFLIQFLCLNTILPLGENVWFKTSVLYEATAQSTVTNLIKTHSYMLSLLYRLIQSSESPRDCIDILQPNVAARFLCKLNLFFFCKVVSFLSYLGPLRQRKKTLGTKVKIVFYKSYINSIFFSQK